MTKGKYLKPILQYIRQIAFAQKHKWKLMIKSLHGGKLCVFSRDYPVVKTKFYFPKKQSTFTM